MSIFNPYGNKPFLTICRERYRLFRIYILAVGIISLLNCFLIAIGSNTKIFYSAYLPCAALETALNLFGSSNTILGILLCVAAIAVSVFYIAMYFISSKKYAAVAYSFVFFVIDTIVMAIKINSIGLEFILGHILIIILFTWGMISTKRLVEAEREQQKEKMRD